MSASPKPKESLTEALTCTLERSALLSLLSHVHSVVERRNTIPILGNVKLQANGGALHMTATDMDLAITDQVSADTAVEGATTAPAHTFYDIVRKLPDGAEVTLETLPESGKLSIQAGKSHFSLACLPAEDFPEMEGGEFTHQFTLTAMEAATLLDKSRFAMSTEETRYYLNGIYLHPAGGKGEETLRAVATDGHRLARIEVALPAGAKGMPGIIIPRKTVAELKKLVEEHGEAIQIAVSESKAKFVCGKTMLITKLIDGTFPDYERVIPDGNDKLAEIDAKAFAQAVDRVSTISADKLRGVKLKMEHGTATLTASSPEHGNAEEELDITYGADPIEIGFNARYLLDVLAQIEGDSVQFVLADGSAPAILRDSASVGALYVVMPMRV